MYDTVMQNWAGGAIQTRSHAGTLCQQIETKQGLDTIYISPDKHGNYLTIGGCGASFICNPGCGGIPSRKNVRPVNIGEPNAALIADLGTAYPGYAGEDPWTTANFLAAQNGGAGPIREKMLLPLESAFIQGSTLTSQAQICDIYSHCFSTGSAYLDYTCEGEAYHFYGQTLTQAGTYSHILTGSRGCDSTITLTLAVLSSNRTGYGATVCHGESYNFNGRLISASGTYSDTLSNGSGCDSIITLNLFVNPPDGRDYNALICKGGTYLFNGNALSTVGIYIDSLTNSSGCDSIVRLTLLVDSVPPLSGDFLPDTVAADAAPIVLTGASPAGGVYSGAAVSGGMFNPNLAIPGFNTVTYTYTDSIGCSDSMVDSVFVRITTGINPLSQNLFMVYPNPAHNMLNIQFAEEQNNGLLTLLNLQGEVVQNWYVRGKSTRLDISSPAGVYILQLTSSSNTIVERVVIK